ncbi:MAG: hypothetical protein E7074_00450 [Bacteroidales bacterium]|nr:hypothetical protein [Bacteroidales bacterium]
MVLGAGVDNAEEGKHGLGMVAGFAEETTIIIIRVRVGGRIDQAERLKGGDSRGQLSTIVEQHTLGAEGVSGGNNVLRFTDGCAGAEAEQQQCAREDQRTEGMG